MGFKDHCGHDAERFAKCVADRDEEMICKINDVCGGPEMAVEHGGSFR